MVAKEKSRAEKPAPKSKSKPAAKVEEKPKGPPKKDLSLENDLLDGILADMDDDEQERPQLLGSDGLALKIRGVISTQDAQIDGAIGRGGAPLGRLTILHGAEASGKTTLALSLVAEAQRLGGMAVYMDKEYKLDPEYASKLGVDTGRLIISQPPHLQKVFFLLNSISKRAAAIREKRGKRIPILVVLDSMNACISKAEYDGEYEQNHVAAVPRVFSALLPKLMPTISKEDVALVFISQIRKKIGVMFGDDEEIAGGNAPKFYASLVLHVKRLAAERTSDGEKIGNKIRVEPKKNQIAPPFKRANTTIFYGRGFDHEASALERGFDLGIVKKKGAIFYYEGAKVGNGIKNASKYLRKHPELQAKLAVHLRKTEGWE